MRFCSSDRKSFINEESSTPQLPHCRDCFSVIRVIGGYNFLMKDIVIVSGKRTPMAEYGGALRDLSALELGAIAARGAIEQSKFVAADFDHAIFGNALQTSGDAL